MPDALTEAEKEKLKLRAAAYDRLSTAVVTVGVLVPGVALLTRDPALSALPPNYWLVLAAVGLSVVLHYVAWQTLGRLDR